MAIAMLENRTTLALPGSACIPSIGELEIGGAQASDHPFARQNMAPALVQQIGWFGEVAP
jgi:hypothetical protein